MPLISGLFYQQHFIFERDMTNRNVNDIVLQLSMCDTFLNLTEDICPKDSNILTWN